MHIKGTVLVDREKYDEFIKWYMKYSNIETLQIRNKVNTKYVIDRKDDTYIAYTHCEGYDIFYGICEYWYDKYINSK